jgi:CHASE2 domain-containing sensor protein
MWRVTSMNKPAVSPRSSGSGRRPSKAFVSLLLLMLLQRGIESVGSLKAFELAGYNALQLLLDWSSQPPLPVVIVDISDMPPEGGITPRTKLRELLTALTTIKDARVLAIGIDIDFSPENNVFVSPEDPAFFEACRGLGRLGIPVFLGVSRSAGSAREAWLGRREFADLAAAIVVPEASGTTGHGGAPGPYPVFIPRLGADAVPAELRSMAVALASVSRPDIEDTLTTPDFFVDPIVEHSVGKGREIPEFTVDYSFIRRLRRTSVSPRWDAKGQLITAFDPGSLNDKLVLIGDLKGSSETDVFPVAGITGKASGVLVHASATMTLLQGPLRALKEWLRTAIEITLLVIVPFCLSRRERFRRWRRFWLIFASISIVAGAGVLLLSMRILWFDWLPVLVLLVTHMLVELREEASAKKTPSDYPRQVAGAGR